MNCLVNTRLFVVNTRLFAGSCTAVNNVRHCFLCNNINEVTLKKIQSGVQHSQGAERRKGEYILHLMTTQTGTTAIRHKSKEELQQNCIGTVRRKKHKGKGVGLKLNLSDIKSKKICNRTALERLAEKALGQKGGA